MSIKNRKEPRSILPLDQGWKFKFGGKDVPWAPLFNDKDWEEVALPHTWNAVDGADGGGDYKRGPGWYRLKFKAPRLPVGRRAYLCFGGVNSVASVWLNGKELGTHLGGYSGFRFDATSVLEPGTHNTLVVRADNSHREDVPPLEGDFTFFGGIYRSVSLLTTSSLSLDLMDLGGPGVYLTTSEIKAHTAKLSVRVRVANAFSAPQKASIRVTLVDREGKSVAKASEVLVALSGVTETFLELTLRKPRLWDGLKDPYLYQALVEVLAGGRLMDRLEQPLGIRSFRMDPQKGFILNGKPYPLRGVNLHQEREGKGNAVSAEDLEEDYSLVREIGATFVRLAHYQHPQKAYDICDREGIVVWAEHALVNKVSSNPLFSVNAVEQLKELITQNFNHPSIAVWGIGNEVQTHQGPWAARLLRRLARLVKTLDPTRPSTIATDKDEAGGAYGTDTIAHNKYFGWYYGVFSDFPKWLDAQRAKAPGVPMGMSEYGAGAGPSIHSRNPKARDHSVEYQLLFHRAHWKAIEKRPWLWCTAVWNMFDFAADHRNEGEKPGINDKGLVTRDRKTRKPAFHWYKAEWGKRFRRGPS